MQTIKRVQRGHKISYQQAYRIRGKIRGDVYDGETESFQFDIIHASNHERRQ